MQCPSCDREAAGEGRFCRFCSSFLLDSDLRLGGLFSRFIAMIVDVFAFWGWLTVGFALFAVQDLGPLLGAVVLIGGFVGWVYLLGKGVTPGKAAMGLRVRKTNGDPPGVFGMLLREWIGKYVSGLVFGLGWLWAIFDRDRQAWHDKIAGTLVVRVSR